MLDQTKRKMGNHAEVAPADHRAADTGEPLFVLKYRPWRILWRLFFPYSMWLPFCYMGFFYWSNDATGLKWWFGKIAFPALLIGGIWLIIDMLMTKGICLSKDIITKNYRFKGKIVVFLGRANFDAMSNWFIALMRIYDEKTPFFLRGFKGVYFDPHLANPQDISRFNEVLAQVTGRSVKELQHTWFSTKLLKSEEVKS